MAASSGSLFDRLIGICFGVLAGAVAIYVAVHLIEAVWLVLLLILGVVALIVVTVAMLRSRHDSW